MSHRVDPVRFSEEWAKAIPISVPVKSETRAARRALTAHATLLYSSPLTSMQDLRRRDSIVRSQLSVYSDLIEVVGFIPSLLFFKKVDQEFLRGFIITDQGLTYEISENIIYTPMYRHAKTLVGRVLDIDGRDGKVIQYIHTWLLYLSKLPLSRPDLLGPAKIAWIARQTNPLPYMAGQSVIEPVRKIVSWLIDDDFQFIGNHGPGSTSTGAKTVPEKNRDYMPSMQTKQLTRFHVDDVFYDDHAPQNARWTAVHKDIGSVRPITMEPPAMQYAQQGMKYDLYRMIDRHLVPAGSFVRFADQTPSRVCALNGSVLKADRFKCSTIDLSSASDFLSVQLVIDLFSGNILHYLLAGRTWNVDVDKQTVELNMYAGMGSALTFPVQTLVFLAISIWAVIAQLVLEETGVEASADDLQDYLNDTGFRKKWINSRIRVYGDDIAIPDFAAQRLIKLLSDFGLLVNVNKSFVGRSPVRESCGIYALAGRDITPKFYRLPVFGRVLDAKAYEAIRSHANEAFFMQHRVLNRFLIRTVRDSKLLISSQEHNRRGRRGLKYPDQRLQDARILFEETRGRDDYIGFVSMKGSKPDHRISLAEDSSAFTTYFPASASIRDDENGFYYLTLSYRKLVDRSFHVETLMENRDGTFTNEFQKSSYDRIPAGTRLVKRNAITLMPHKSARTMVWGWAPR